ncbi:MAG: hypothetical protein U0168_20330, partial [Nannocystaceae bacterium]
MSPAACDIAKGVTGADETASDEALMAAYVAGDRDAFARLFERWAPRLRQLFARNGARPDEAADLVQQSFLQLHRARHD